MRSSAVSVCNVLGTLFYIKCMEIATHWLNIYIILVYLCVLRCVEVERFIIYYSIHSYSWNIINIFKSPVNCIFVNSFCHARWSFSSFLGFIFVKKFMLNLDYLLKMTWEQWHRLIHIVMFSYVTNRTFSIVINFDQPIQIFDKILQI